MANYLPSSPGFLPKWLLFISVVSIGNSIQAYSSLAATKQVYANANITPLSARTFGTWTALSSIIRLYAAYHINNPLMYEICMWTFGVAFMHFAAEWLIFGTAKWGRGLAGPVAVSTATGIWMFNQWSEYVQ